MTAVARHLAVAAGFALVLAAAAAAAPAKPSLHALGVSPLRVRGTAFAPLVRVRVAAALPGGTQVRVARASAHGAFTVRFANTETQCLPVIVVVARAGVAPPVTLKLRRMCPPGGGPTR